MPVLRVCPPGTCPGHFDITPGSIGRLQHCRLLFMFDFQQSIADKLSALPGSGPELAPVKVPEGLCVPSSYLEACQVVHGVLARVQPDTKVKYDEALKRTRARLAELERASHERVEKAGLKGANVVSSKHQAAFCRWLGLEVVATYAGGESASPAALQSLVADAKQAHVGLVIANLQEGRQFGRAIAEQVGAELVVFSNFPSMQDGEDSFDALVQHNLAQLPAANSK